MLDAEVEFFHLLKPPGLLPYRIRCLFQPGKRGMIGSYAKSTSQKIMLEISKKVYYCKQFLARDAVVPLPLVQGTALECDYSFHSVLALLQDRAD